jgi:hypothetical protein
MANQSMAVLQAHETWWGTQYSGTREQLIAAGLAQDGSFPGDPGRRKTAVRFKAQDGVEITIRKRDTRRYYLSRRLPNGSEELKRRHEDSRRAMEAERALALLPKSAEDYRRFVGRIADFKALRMTLGLWVGGYCFESTDSEEIGELLAELQGAIENARIRYSPTRRSKMETRIRGEALPKEDKPFEEFMRNVSRIPEE